MNNYITIIISPVSKSATTVWTLTPYFSRALKTCNCKNCSHCRCKICTGFGRTRQERKSKRNRACRRDQDIEMFRETVRQNHVVHLNRCNDDFSCSSMTWHKHKLSILSNNRVLITMLMNDVVPSIEAVSHGVYIPWVTYWPASYTKGDNICMHDGKIWNTCTHVSFAIGLL